MFLGGEVGDGSCGIRFGDAIHNILILRVHSRKMQFSRLVYSVC